MKVLLAEPDFPIPQKSKNHKNFLPIGLLKLASYYREKGDKIKLIRGNKDKEEIFQLGNDDWYVPDEIMITSLFTYWAQYIKSSVEHYRRLFPYMKITVGGIYASLMPEDCKNYTGCDEVYEGVKEEAEKCFPAYDLIENANPHPIDYQIIHASRGCVRTCEFCGTHKIEPKFIPKKTIKNDIKYKKIVFYDNNFLANPYIEDILGELIELKKERKILWCESQSGFDGRILLEKPRLAKMIKKAGFRAPRIAWDWGHDNYKEIKDQIDILVKAGYPSKYISVFMLYNWDIPFEEMEKKRIKCWEWKVQITDCRYRPLDRIIDNYNPRKTKQTKRDYYIHNKAGWTDKLIRRFRSNIRKQNICVRQDVNYYSANIERKRIPKEEVIKYKKLQYDEAKKHVEDAWNPNDIHCN
ncbi:MAG: cobalamin-dependent protein [Methanomicrobia archaeon]|nr:cobalamin-dependent protein [Methanomicrobia archaeon]